MLSWSTLMEFKRIYERKLTQEKESLDSVLDDTFPQEKWVNWHLRQIDECKYVLKEIQTELDTYCKND